MEKYTIKDFNKEYPNEQSCLDKLFQSRFGNLSSCLKCQKPFKYYFIKNYKRYDCAFCGHSLFPTANTIYHKSSTKLRDWFYIIFLFSISKNGISAKEIERQIGVTYKTAWRMSQKIRELMNDNVLFSNDSQIEIDETYIGGKEINKHEHNKTSNTQGRSYKSKFPVLGMLDRESKKIKAFKVDNVKSKTIKNHILSNVSNQNKIYTDEFRGYTFLGRVDLEHLKVNHGIKEYVNGKVHTNSIEGFWSIFKRAIQGTYIHISKKYLQKYIDEFTFRYNYKTENIFSILIKKY